MTMTQEQNMPQYQPKDFKSDQVVRWCPGCGDHAILNVLHKAMSSLGIAPHDTAVISGMTGISAFLIFMAVVVLWPRASRLPIRA